MSIIKFLYSFFIINLISCSIIAQQPMVVTPGQPPIFPELTKEDIDEIEKFINSLSEEERNALEQLGRDILTEMNINPDTFEPIEPIPGAPTSQPTPAAPVLAPQEVPVAAKGAEVSGEMRQEIKDLLASLIQHLESLRLKMHTESSFKMWFQEIDDILYYLKVINQPRYFEHLGEATYAPLLQQLRQLNAVLVAQEPSIVLRQIKPAEDDPYEILGISANAAEEEIQEAYDQLSTVRNPEAIRKEREAEGLAGKDLERAVKEARLSFEIIEDAYEKLIDPKTRADIDREREASHSYYKEAEQQSQRAFGHISQALSNAIYNNKLIENMEQFLKQFAPRELEQKKALEAAEKQRQQEQAELARRRPTPSPGGPFEPRLKYGEVPPALPSLFPSAGGITPSGAEPSKEQKGLPEAEKGKGGEKPKKEGEKKKEEKEKDKDKEKGKEKKEKEGGKDKSKAKEQEKSIKEAQDILKLFDTIAKDFEQFKKTVEQENNKKLLTQLPAYLFAPSAPELGEIAVPGEAAAPEATEEMPKPEELINKDLNNQLGKFIDDAKLETLYKDLKEESKKLGKKVDARIRPYYTQKWNPLYQDYAGPLKALTAATSYIQPDKKMSQEKLLEHVGTPDNPQPLGKLHNLLSKTTKMLEKINKLLNPEQYKQDGESAPKQTKSR